MHWVVEEAKKCDPGKNRLVLENPGMVRELDRLLLKTYYPVIHSELEKTTYLFEPHPDDVEIMSRWDCGDLGRALVFFLLDDSNSAFFRGEFSCSKDGFFLERELFLGLPETTDPSFIFRILGDDKFVGMPPTLTIGTSSEYTDQQRKFIVTLRAGTGFGFRGWTLHNQARELIETTIRDSVALYEDSVVDGFSSMAEVERFLKIAYRCYEAY